VQICGFLDVECGDVRHEGYDFRKIWDTSEVFRRVRDVDSYHGRCGYCEFRKVCGGCRARAYALTGDYMDEEPYCVYEPRRAGAGAEPDAACDLDALDRKLISVIQADLPVCRRPFDALAQRLGADGEQVIRRVRRLRSDGLIRRIGPVFDSARLGYVSTLVAARVPAERLVEVAALVTRLPGVTHNYRRLNAYNLWFTLTAGSAGELEGTLDDLQQQTGIRDFYSLPALAIYKTRVVFSLSDEAPVPPAPHPGWVGDARGLDEGQKGLVRLIQDDLPVVPEPFAELARRLGWPTQRVLDQISEWLAAGVIRRFGAVVAHRRLGFQGNGMAVFRVPPERVDEAGRALARYHEVSHCYRRPPLPEWDYNLFGMVHGRTADEVGPLVARMAAELDAPDYDILFSTVEYKKTSMKYFCEGVRAPSRPE
jgi:radical SAM protein with 4Fe4S-binding SPASM domain